MPRTDWSCLAFTRTVGWEARDRPDDELVSYDALVAWAERRSILAAGRARTLRRLATRSPDEAARMLSRAIALRALLYRILSAVGAGQAPEPRDLESLNAWLPEANAHLRLIPEGAGYAWGWSEEADRSLESVLWPLLRSAAELLTANELARVKLCDGDGCGWLFVDASRNRSRRWCDMSDCGNRAKVRRYRRRQRSEP